MTQPAPLPCPFCGECPLVGPTDDTQGNAWGYVRCNNNHCQAQPEVLDGEVADERGRSAYQMAAIIRWNRRANRRSLQMVEALLERWRGELSEYGEPTPTHAVHFRLCVRELSEVLERARQAAP